MPKSASGKIVMKLLMRHYGFEFESQRGSHAKLRKYDNGRIVTTIIPMHRELAVAHYVEF